jgi:hypothetical protein
MLWGHKAPLCRPTSMVGCRWSAQCGAVVLRAAPTSRLPRPRRPRPRTRGAAAGPADRSRQRQPPHRITPSGCPVPTRGPLRRPAGLVRLRHAGHPQLPRCRQHPQHPFRPCCARRPLRSGRTLSIGNHRCWFRCKSQSPMLRRRSPSSPPRSPTSATSSATKPTNRSPARVRR